MSTALDPEKLFGKGAPLERLYPLYEATETIVLTPGKVTRGASHVRDALDLKRMMILVVIALVPAILFGVYNIGYQAHLAIEAGAEPLNTWQTQLFQMIGLQLRSDSILACVVHGLLYYLPILIVTGAIGGNLEAAVCDHPQTRDQRRLPGDLDAVPADPAADDSAVAGRPGHRVRRRARARRSLAGRA